MLGVLLTTLVFIGILFGASLLTNLQDIKKNWAKYRCRPDVMMMAPLYGHNAQENLEFCLKQGFDGRAMGAIAPFYTIMGSFVNVLMTMLGSINSIRMTFATIVGTAATVFSEFSQRFQALMYRIQMSVMRIKFLFSRVFAVIYSILFMGMGGMRAGINFSNTFLFRFLDTFCFDPDTPIQVLKAGSVVSIPIKEVKIGDILATGGSVTARPKDGRSTPSPSVRVTATFSFWADGQPMVRFPDGTLVSTNHYVSYNDSWIQAVDHPDAEHAAPWNGGISRPLICLNTDSHTFRVGSYLFRDYDETSEGDAYAMAQALKQMNGCKTVSKVEDSTMACDPHTQILLHNSDKIPGAALPVEDIQLGQHLSTGVVHGIIIKETYSYCTYKGNRFAPGTSVWDEETHRYRRVGDLVPTVTLKNPIEYYSLIVTPGATIETANGLMFRDYMEVHDPDLEASYASALAYAPS